jgi:hypothetical protein
MFPAPVCVPLHDWPGDFGNFLNQAVQKCRYVSAIRKIGALPGPHRHKIGLARSLGCDSEISDEFSLQRIWQDLDSVSVQVLHHAVVDCPCESSREAFCQTSMSGIVPSQSFAMKADGAGFLAR